MTLAPLPHVSRGPLFETFVLSELVKDSMNRGLRPDIGFPRDKQGREVGLVMSVAEGLRPIEIKAGQTYQPSWSRPARLWQSKMAETMPLLDPCVVYGGGDAFVRDATSVVGWRQFASRGL